MGCDYYTWIETVVEYTDGEGKTKTYVEKPDFDHYERHYDGYSEHDADFEDPYNPLEEKKSYYGEKDLYTDGKWVCKPAGIARMTQMLETNTIPLERVTRIFKQLNGYWR
jgi:hypothetical protein